MKKLFILLSIVATFSVAGYSQSYNYDVDGDGEVTSSDVTALYDYLLGVDVASYANLDVNGDGEVTSADVTALYDYLLGIVPVEPPVNHEYVDLGLPSGTLWATMNIGATAPEDYGDHFSWGETTPKETYNWTTYMWCLGNYNTMIKYCTSSYYGNEGFVDNKSVLDPEDDAATVNWGAEWCMPTKEQFEELRDNCTRVWTTINDVKGCLLTSNINGASLFLPAAGYRWDTTIFKDTTDGFYWSRALKTNGPGSAYSMYFSSGSLGTSSYSRGYGQSVRAVRVP